MKYIIIEPLKFIMLVFACKDDIEKFKKYNLKYIVSLFYEINPDLYLIIR